MFAGSQRYSFACPEERSCHLHEPLDDDFSPPERLRNASGRAGFVQERPGLFGRLGLRVGMALSRDCEQALSLFTDCVRLTRKRLSHRDAADLGV